MKQAKHILILTPGFPSDEKDDTCMPYLQVFLKEASKQKYGLTFSIITIQYPYKSGSYFWFGIPVYSCGGGNRSFPLRFYYWRKAWKKLHQIHTKKPIDAVHSLWLSECTLVAQKWTGRNNVKHIATAMGQDVLKSNRYLRQINLNSLSLVAVSNYQNNSLQKSVGKSASKIIPWGTESFKCNGSKRTIDVLGVGSLTHLKAFDSFLRIVARVVKSHSNLRVTLIGSGPEQDNLEHLTHSLKIEKNVQFLGQIQHKKVLEIMQQSKVLLHTSTYESQGFVFNEAIASGMAIVSKQVGLAKRSERWAICQSESEMATCVESKLKQEFNAEALMPVESTVNQYIGLYASW